VGVCTGAGVIAGVGEGVIAGTSDDVGVRLSSGDSAKQPKTVNAIRMSKNTFIFIVLP
jgi:hypothetical protein